MEMQPHPELDACFNTDHPTDCNGQCCPDCNTNCDCDSCAELYAEPHTVLYARANPNLSL